MNLTELYNLARRNGWDSKELNENVGIEYNEDIDELWYTCTEGEFWTLNTTNLLFNTNFIKRLLIDFDVDKLPLNSLIHSDLVYHRPDLYLIMHLSSLNSQQDRLDLLLKIFA